LQFAAAITRATCRLFQLLALCRSFFARTFNPEVAGSNPARPKMICRRFFYADNAREQELT